jgi:hypothetical protein
MTSVEKAHEVVEPRAQQFYRRTLRALGDANIPFLVGGAFAFAFGHYTGIIRHTKDFDIFLRRADVERALATLAAAGYQADLIYPHWLGKAYEGEFFVDLIFSAGNGVAVVDEAWFEHAQPCQMLGEPVKLCSPEEIIWSKAFVQERERYDGADVSHLLRARADTLDWQRLLDRFGWNWRVLLGQLVMFGFVYPAERDKIPAWVMDRLTAELQRETHAAPPDSKLCRGTLVSRQQYLKDVQEWGYRDARLQPEGNMSAADIAHWTAAIDGD